jgi:mono/diheme cytochrome c family protein
MRTRFVIVHLVPCLVIVITLGALMGGCRYDMQDQPKYLPYSPSKFFEDGRSARPLVPHTVARGHLDDAPLLYTGKTAGALADEFPFPVTADVLRRGQERYNIFCSPCHDRVGSGGGMIVQRGYRRPPPFHLQRLREAPAGYVFDVITRGFGVMPSYQAQIPVEDRWAIVAYVRALQLSQYTSLANVPETEREQLRREAAGQPIGPGPLAPPPLPTAPAPANQQG